MALQNNYFIEEIMPNAILWKLSAEEMAQHRRPFAEPGEGRRPTLTWPRQIPIEGEPADVVAIATVASPSVGGSTEVTPSFSVQAPRPDDALARTMRREWLAALKPSTMPTK